MILRNIRTVFLIIGILFAVNLNAQTNGIFNITDLGAVGDGNKINTLEIQKAIDKASENDGVVLIPPGKFVTGSLELKSNVTINIMKGSTILGSTDIADYKEHIPGLKSYNDIFLRYSLFYAEKAENISIKGEGTINGRGSAFPRKTKKKPERYMNRPYVIRFVECNNVTIEGISMRNSAMWMQQYLACKYLTIRGINVYNHANYNNDMMDIDGCRNVIISDCFGDTDDDGITIKSTSDRITENVTITNCVISSHCNAIKMGTESIGGFRNVTISNIVVKPSESKTKIYGFHGGISGITLGLVDGGILEGVLINNIRIDGPQVPIYLRLGNRGRTIRNDMKKPPVGVFKNVSINNVIATNTGQIGCSITGLKDYPIENVTLSNIQITFKGGVTEKIDPKVPELEDHYPESNMYGILPAYGFFVRHVNNITFSNVELRLENKDIRPDYIFEDVKDLKQIK